jgi:hypothetical protein
MINYKEGVIMANRVITIGRQFGSNGRLIGEKLAEIMGVKCYDKQLIKEAAKTIRYVGRVPG